MTARDDLTPAERQALADWWDSDWPDDVDGVLGTLGDVVAGIVGGRVRAASDHVAGILRAIADERIDGQLDRLTWRAAFLAAARIVEEDAAKRLGASPESGDTDVAPKGRETGAEGAEWPCLHCGGSHETHEGDCCCHGRDEGDDE